MEDLVTATKMVLCAVASMDIQETAVKHLQVYTVYRIYLMKESVKPNIYITNYYHIKIAICLKSLQDSKACDGLPCGANCSMVNGVSGQERAGWCDVNGYCGVLSHPDCGGTQFNK